MKTITTMIKWRNAAEELPEKSCEVVAFAHASGYMKILPYSAKHGVFNAIDLESRETAIGHCITVDYWCYADEMRLALTTFPEEETLHGKFELARGEKKIKFREEAEKEEAKKNAFAKALKERFADLASEKSQTRGESVIKLRMTPEKVMQVFRDSARFYDREDGTLAYFLDDETRAAVIDALYKQIPQAMQRAKDKGLSGYICPACGNPYAGNRYCDRCGQRLEW